MLKGVEAMFKSVMLNAKFNHYVESYELEEENPENNVKRYICYTYLLQIQPERLERDINLLDSICDSRLHKYGIIGFAIALNNQFLTTKTDIDDILQNERKGKFDIYLLTQQGNINADRVLNEIKGKPENFEFAEIISYMNSQKIVLKWEELPTLNLIIISEENKEVITTRSDSLIKKIYHINEDKLFRIAKSNDNDYAPILEYTDGFPMTNAGKKGQTIVALCDAEQLIHILENEDGMIRSNIFDANVRAYQGNTDVNNEIMKTLQNCPENFVLYNNGITIVCSKLEHNGKTLQIATPQIVNGCQTCTSLFMAHKKKIDLSKVKVLIKTIETTDEIVMQGIVRGTNRQNIVYEEAFETVRQFHKDLEDFFNVIQVPGFQKIYYERRSKQYYFEPQIKPYQKVNFRILIQSMVALYMNKVEISHRHESKLLTEYKNKLFVEGQSLYPYYVAALLTTNMDYLMKKKRVFEDVKSYKMHILFVLQELNMGPAPEINDKDAIETYCKKFLDILSKGNFEKLVTAAANSFRELMQKWIETKGNNYRFAMKDRPEFTEFMLEELRGNKKRNTSDSIYHGRVLNVNTDKNGNLYGFIECSPNNIYFNNLDNPKMNAAYVGKTVLYKVSGVGNMVRAINVKLV